MGNKLDGKSDINYQLPYNRPVLIWWKKLKIYSPLEPSLPANPLWPFIPGMPGIPWKLKNIVLFSEITYKYIEFQWKI